ncbi:MAG: hypothetical protein ABIJ57_03290, partial [Pseudomonadota bacterium]
ELGKQATIFRNILFKEELKSTIRKPRDEAQKVAAELKLGELTGKGKPFIDAKYKELAEIVKKAALAKGLSEADAKDFSQGHALSLSQYPLTDTYETDKRIDIFIEDKKVKEVAEAERARNEAEAAKKKVAEAERVQKEDYARKARQEAAKKTLGPVAKAVHSDEIFEGEEGFVKAIEKAIGRKLNDDVDEAAVTRLVIRGVSVTTGELGADLRDALRNSTAVPMKTRKSISEDMVGEFGIIRTEPASTAPIKSVKDRKQVYANMMTFASEDVARRNLNGFSSSDGNLVSTNGHALFVHYGAAETLKDKSIHTVENGVLSEIEGEFPDYKRVIPADRAEDRERSITADQATKLVAMLKATAKRNLLAQNANGKLGSFAVALGDNSVNGWYLSDILTGVLKTGADRIIITTPDKNTGPFVFDGYQGKKQTAKGIVLPVRGTQGELNSLALTAEDLGGKPEAPQGEISKKDMTPTKGMFEKEAAAPKAEPATPAKAEGPIGSERGSVPIKDSETIAAILKAKGKISEAMPHLEALGQSVYGSGKVRFSQWQAAMKTKLGGLWEGVKKYLRGVWDRIKFGEIGPLGNQRGAVGGAETGGKYNRRAIAKYGLTPVDESVGFVTRDGKKIDSSGKRQGSRSEGRNVDHREIAQHALGDESVEGWSQNLTIFMNLTGNVRVVGAREELNIDVPIKNGMPSNKQIIILERMAAGKKVYYDFSDETGRPVGSGEGTFGKFKRELAQTIQKEAEIKTARESGVIPKQLQPIA